MTGKTDYYCNQKFWWLSINLERREQQSCCSADPCKIDFKWLENNPGRLFNTPLLLQERQDMLDNRPVSSCWQSCFGPAQDQKINRRTTLNGDVRSHTSIESTPEALHIILGSNCNMTCAYCCKQYSTAWTRDLINNGEYPELDQRFQLTATDRILLKISQAENQNSNQYSVVLDEISRFDNLTTVYVSGGEPFLYNQLSDLVNKISANIQVKITTGLGVDPTRFKKQLEKIQHLGNRLQIVISGESVDNLYEFVRYGNRYSTFVENMNTLQSMNFDVHHNVVVSNITVAGLDKFVHQYPSQNYSFSICNDPTFLSVNVLDQETKAQAIDSIRNTDISIKDQIIDNINLPCSTEQHQMFSNYIQEFSNRRNLDLNVLPESLRHWIINAKNN